MQAAIAVICSEGVGKATFANIAQLGGYSRGLVTHRFGSRQGLIESVIAYLHSRPEAVAIEQRVDEIPALDGLLAYVDIYVRHLATDREGQAITACFQPRSPTARPSCGCSPPSTSDSLGVASLAS